MHLNRRTGRKQERHAPLSKNKKNVMSQLSTK